MKGLIVIAFYTFLSISVEAKSPLEPIQLSSGRQATQLNFILDHLKKFYSNPEEERKILEKFKVMNENLKYISYENFILFIETEITKSILNFSTGKSTIEISGNQLIIAQNLLKSDRKKYSSFALFLMERVLQDFSPHIISRLVYNYKNPKYRTQKNSSQIKKIKLLNKYLGRLATYFATKTPEEFHGYLNRLAFYTIANLTRSSYAFAHAAPHSKNQGTLTFINLEQVSFKETQANNNQPEQSIPNPKQDIQKITSEKDPSVEIDQLIEDVEPNKN